MMVYSEEPIWPMPHIPALYDDGDYGGKKDRQTDKNMMRTIFWERFRASLHPTNHSTSTS